ncbi:MAG: response regulator [Cyclobacteriaceae bacterium]|nr:response regulator [Cyclobacteriaceae bacterium]
MNNSIVEILLIEDDEHDAEMTIRALQKSRITNGVVHLKDGSQALQFLFGTGEFAGRNVNMKPKVILLDLKMPKVDGIEVLQQIKSNELTKKIPVVVLTSSKENPDIDTCYALGANSYIVKPVDFAGFMEAIAHSGMYWVMLNQFPQQSKVS